jgi:hypothetical protein
MPGMAEARELPTPRRQEALIAADKETRMARIRVLSPVGVIASRATAVPPLPREWGGRTIGFLDNTKSNFDRLSAGIGELMRERYGVAAVVHRRKANASTPAAPEVIAELSKTCDVVFAGSAD